MAKQVQTKGVPFREGEKFMQDTREKQSTNQSPPATIHVPRHNWSDPPQTLQIDKTFLLNQLQSATTSTIISLPYARASSAYKLMKQNNVFSDLHQDQIHISIKLANSCQGARNKGWHSYIIKSLTGEIKGFGSGKVLKCTSGCNSHLSGHLGQKCPEAFSTFRY